MTGRWVAASLNAHGFPQRLEAEPRHDSAAAGQAAADERAFLFARRGGDVVRLPDGSWRVRPGWDGDAAVVRIVVFEASGPQTVFPPPMPPPPRQPEPEPEPRCSVYRPGHRVHYIQARKSLEDHGEGVPCEVVQLIDPDVVIIGFGKARRRWHNHDLPRLRKALAAVGSQAHIYERKRMLRLGNRCFCIAMPEDWEPDCDACPNDGFLVRPRL